jgi:hypothetical protein
MKAHFLNPEGYVITKDILASAKAGKTIYDFQLKNAPLMFVDSKGTWWRTEGNFLTDQGSIPWLCEGLVEHDRLLAFYFHDSCYRQHGLYRSIDSGGSWTLQIQTREQADQMLYDGAIADPEPLNKCAAWCVWCAVRLGGGWAWKRRSANG